MNKFFVNTAANRVLCLLIATDVIFVGLHIAVRLTECTSNPLVLLYIEYSYSEVYQYTKIFWIVLLTGSIAIRIHSPLCYVWTIIFMYLLLDDALEIHETIGGKILGDRLSSVLPVEGIVAYDLGQLIFAILVCAALLTAVLIAYYFSTKFVRAISRYLLLLLGAFAFFSIAADAIIAFTRVRGCSFIEDGGELIVMSAIVWFILSVHVYIDKHGAVLTC